MTAGAFFLRDGEAFVGTEHTRGPWDDRLMHGGPPAALLVRAAERVPADVPMHLARLTVELARPAPLGVPLQVKVEVTRAGRATQALRLLLLDGERELYRAHALRARTVDLALPPEPEEPPLPAPEACPAFSFPFFRCAVGYHTAIEGRAARGTWGQGRFACWMRQRVPLIEGEAPSPLERLIVAADAGSGVGLLLDPARFTFVNPDLTVATYRAPEGEWIGMDARTHLGPAGLGQADVRLHDARGPVGRSAQTLLLERR